MILAIDTASKTATVALVENKKIIAEYSAYSNKTHSKALLPMIESVFRTTERIIDDIDFIACVNGPGSFTGLRIGASAAKSFSYALSKKIAPISALDVLAYGAFMPDYTVCTVIDARNGYVYCCFYNRIDRLTDYMTIPVEQAVDIGNGFNRPLYFVGSGADCYAGFLSQKGALVAEPYLNQHRAGALGVYAESKENLELVDARNFEPVYYHRQERD